MSRAITRSGGSWSKSERLPARRHPRWGTVVQARQRGRAQPREPRHANQYRADARRHHCGGGLWCPRFFGYLQGPALWRQRSGHGVANVTHSNMPATAVSTSATTARPGSAAPKPRGGRLRRLGKDKRRDQGNGPDDLAARWRLDRFGCCENELPCGGQAPSPKAES